MATTRINSITFEKLIRSQKPLSKPAFEGFEKEIQLHDRENRISTGTLEATTIFPVRKYMGMYNFYGEMQKTDLTYAEYIILFYQDIDSLRRCCVNN